MSTTVRRLLVVLALIGLASSLTSLYIHIQMVRNPAYLSFCDVSATINCTQVYQSRYAAVAGVPVALWGSLWYIAVVILLAGSAWGWSSLRENAGGYVFAAATIGLGAVIYFAYTSLFLLKAVCLMCLVTYLAVAGIFLISGARTLFPMTTLPRRLWQDLRAAAASPMALATVLVFLISATAAIAFVPRHEEMRRTTADQTPADKKSEFIRFWEGLPRIQVPVPSEGAALLIVKFSDFQCPGCAQSYLDSKELLARYRAQYPGAIKLVTKDYPLEQECNANMQRDVHLAACESAVAARLARLKGRGEAMEDWLYTNHASLTPAGVRQAARDVGGVTDFDAQYATTLNQVKSDIALATILGIKMTPTFFLNGVRVDGGMPLQYFELALQYELKKAGIIKP